MLDLSYFQNNNSNVQGFFNGGTWQTWVKPRGAKLVYIICQGSGGGAGGGFQSATTPRSGGGAGGTGATARLSIDANLLPDTLYILPGIGGNGGLGGTTATSGSSGQNSFVTLTPNTSPISNVILRSGTTPARGGGAGTTTSAGGGVGESTGSITNNIFASLGTYTFQLGANSFGGATTNGGVTTPSTPMTAAQGGGGTGTGGGFTASGAFPTNAIAQRNTNGINGPIFYKPMLILYGGLGGGGSLSSGSGGNGGNGAPGTGGGGGGASFNTGVNAGNGGRGGDGFVIITTNF
jgi:hypothetical protein